VLLGILAAAAAGPRTPAIAADGLPPGARTALAPARSTAGPGVPDALLQRGLMAWAALFGTVSFELFGQLHGLVGDQPDDREAFFAESVRRWAEHLGIAAGGTAWEPESPEGSWSPPETETTTAVQVIENSASHTAKKISS
jgi:hypothetical protein